MGGGSAVSGIIVAGGESRRMGRDKALIEFNGKPLIEHVIDSIRPLCREIIIVAYNAAPFVRFNCRIVPDIMPGKGSLGGVFSGLKASTDGFVFAAACDMPFLNRGLIQYMLSIADGYDVVIPRASDPSGNSEGMPHQRRRFFAKDKNLHPLHSVYSRECLNAIELQLLSGDLRMVGFLDMVRVRVVETDEIDRFDSGHLSFFNINTPHNIETARLLQGPARPAREWDAEDV